MARWIDMRRPPQCLLKLVESEDYEDRMRAASALGNYAHRVSVQTLTILLNDKHHFVRSSAISSLAYILQFSELSDFKQSVGLAIADHLFIKDDYWVTVQYISRFLENPMILGKYFLAIQDQIDREPIPKKDSETILCMLTQLKVVFNDNCEYIVRKIIALGLVGPGLHHRIVKQGLTFLYSVDPTISSHYFAYHLQAFNGDYDIRAYGNGPKLRYENRAGIREISARIISNLASKPENFSKPRQKDLLIQAINALVVMFRPEKPGNEYAYKKQDRLSAINALWRIAENNPPALKEEMIGKKTYKLLPEKIREYLKSKIAT